MKKIEVLDCTFRDGGYYNNWDFPSSTFDIYIESIIKLPIDIIEIGYRSLPQVEYQGEFFYTPDYIFDNIKLKGYKGEIAIMLDEKSSSVDILPNLLNSIQGKVDIVRIASAPDKLNKALDLCRAIKQLGFKVGLNLMYVSKWSDDEIFINQLKNVDGQVDYLYLVDSYGGAVPSQIAKVFRALSLMGQTKIGFHGHNNIELAFINTLTAIENGCDIVDATIAGMGRGAGNLKTELFLAYLDQQGINVDFDSLSQLVEEFMNLHKQFGWGTNLPYMVSGFNSLPQKDVMDWVGLNRYSIDSIVRALQNKKKEENILIAPFIPLLNHKRALIVGGGSSATKNISAVSEFVKDKSCIIHSSTRNAIQYNNIDVDQFYCLVGNEGSKLEHRFKGLQPKHQCIIAPSPRKMGVYLPRSVSSLVYELKEINFIERFKDSPLCIAIQTAIDLGVSELYFIGFDGYNNDSIIEHELFNENQQILDLIYGSKLFDKIEFLSHTKYKIANNGSIYSYL